MSLLYLVDFTALANQSLAAGGGHTIDGKTWYAKGNLGENGNTYVRDVVAGLGLAIRKTAGGGGTTLGNSGNLDYPHLVLPLSEIPQWAANQTILVRARFGWGAANSHTNLIGLVDTTDDGIGLRSAQRPKDNLVGPTQTATTTAAVSYKRGASGIENAGGGRAGTIANVDCVAGILDGYSAGWAIFGSEFLASGMPSATSSWRPATANSAGDPNFEYVSRANPGIFFAPHGPSQAGNLDAYLRALRIDTIGDLNDGQAPTATLISPPIGRINRHSTLVVRVADADMLKRVNLWVEYGNGVAETIYARGVFMRAFAARSTMNVIAVDQEFEFRLQRAGGWPSGSMDFQAEPIDRGGNFSS